jgi:hypothetical protein
VLRAILLDVEGRGRVATLAHGKYRIIKPGAIELRAVATTSE